MIVTVDKNKDGKINYSEFRVGQMVMGMRICGDDDFGQIMKMVVIIMRNKIIVCYFIIWGTCNTKF